MLAIDGNVIAGDGCVVVVAKDDGCGNGGIDVLTELPVGVALLFVSVCVFHDDGNDCSIGGEIDWVIIFRVVELPGDVDELLLALSGLGVILLFGMRHVNTAKQYFKNPCTN